MNLSGILGIITAIGVAAFTVVTATDSATVFLDIHGIVIVIGGTVAVTLLSFRVKRIYYAFKIILRKILGGRKSDYNGQIRIIVETADKYRHDPKSAVEGIPSNSHPFFMDGMKYLVEFGFSAVEIDEILTNALKGKKQRDDHETKVWHTMSRFPPAFGLLGATVGMIALLQTLGQPGAQDRIGPAMATALVATFYGLVLANLVLIPISENLSELSDEDIIMRKIIKEGVLLIQEKRHPLFIEEYLKSFLSPKERSQEILGSSDADAA